MTHLPHWKCAPNNVPGAHKLLAVESIGPIGELGGIRLWGVNTYLVLNRWYWVCHCGRVSRRENKSTGNSSAVTRVHVVIVTTRWRRAGRQQIVCRLTGLCVATEQLDWFFHLHYFIYTTSTIHAPWASRAYGRCSTPWLGPCRSRVSRASVSPLTRPSGSTRYDHAFMPASEGDCANVQFQSTMRDKDGRVLVNAHVLGWFS